MPIDAAIQSNLRDTTTRVLAPLTPREERIVRMRFGIGINSDQTLEASRPTVFGDARTNSTRSRPKHCESSNTRADQGCSGASSIVEVPGCAACDANAMIIGRVQRRKSVRQRVRLPLMVLGRSLQFRAWGQALRECPELRFHVQLLPLDDNPSALCRIYTALRGTSLAFSSGIFGISRHKSGGGAFIAEIPDTFQSRWISL